MHEMLELPFQSLPLSSLLYKVKEYSHDLWAALPDAQ
jgi:hypothetical protein